MSEYGYYFVDEEPPPASMPFHLAESLVGASEIPIREFDGLTFDQIHPLSQEIDYSFHDRSKTAEEIRVIKQRNLDILRQKLAKLRKR